MAKIHQVLILGVGSIGERHLRCFRATGRAEVALVEINPALRQAVAERYGVRRAYADLDQALGERFDAAVVAVPAPWHVPLATRLAGAGVHVLIEKPLSTSVDGVAPLRQALAERRLVAAVAYVYRVHPILTALRQRLRDGHFGRPVQLVATSGQHFPTYRPAYRTIYYNDRAAGGGAIQDALTHVVNAGEWLVGPVDRLLADASHQVLEGVQVEDTVHLLTRQGAAMGCYTLNQHQAPNEMTLTVVCERGTLRAEFHAHRLLELSQPGGSWAEQSFPVQERDWLFVRQAETFLDLVEGRGNPPCSLEEGLHTLRVNLAALASTEAGTWQTIPR